MYGLSGNDYRVALLYKNVPNFYSLKSLKLIGQSTITP